MNKKTIAVVTSTIGKPDLERAILSVQAQTYPCKHYVFVDGEQYHHRVKEIADKYPYVIFTYLPMNTGANGWTNSYINAIAPFLVKEDIICYLDDDNWYAPNHTQAIADAFNQYDIQIAFNLRYFYDLEGNHLCDDNSESLGFWFFNDGVHYSISHNQKTLQIHTKLNREYGHIDTNCMAFSLSIAKELAKEWCVIKNNDHHITQTILNSNYTIFCTGQRSVNYVINFDKFLDVSNFLKALDATKDDEYEIKKLAIKGMNTALSPDQYHWLKPTMRKDNQLIILEN